MVTSIYGEDQLTLKELVDLCGYGTTVRVVNAYDGKKFIESCSRPYVNKNSIKKSGVDKKFENNNYVRYGNMPVINIEPYMDQSLNNHRTNDTYVFVLRIKVSAYKFDIEKAKNGEYALTDEQKKEFYDGK